MQQVLRQCHFTAQMDELGWLKSGVFRGANKHEILEHSVMRYHAYAFVYHFTLHVLMHSLPQLS
jgi:hypothetical protein